MIGISQVFSGSLHEVLPLSFFVATGGDNLDILTIGSQDNPWDIVLSGQDPFVCYEHGYHDWSGAAFPDVTIELDPAKVIDDSFRKGPPGSIILVGTEPRIRLLGNHGRAYTRPIYGSDQSQQGGFGVCFPRWQIVIGEGDNKQVLKTVDVSS
ncbi:hypothetical protein [Maricaulis sp.]|uniref:hypothetical protein n=1 Tax=Maricaulis sp. TaxID=1486257 RepID=UPI001B10C7C2|nr:hypothetical protein [Maricaulis sp.]MBO6765816.1 hypothetical protein [Maricaulis sp.]